MAVGRWGGVGGTASILAHVSAPPVPEPLDLPALVERARALAARGLGVGVLTTSQADLPDDLARVEIRSAHAVSYLGVVWRDHPEPSAAAAAMIATLRRRLA